MSLLKDLPKIILPKVHNITSSQRSLFDVKKVPRNYLVSISKLNGNCPEDPSISKDIMTKLRILEFKTDRLSTFLACFIFVRENGRKQNSII